MRVRRACMVEGMSTREARVFGLHRDTVRKMLEYSASRLPWESPPRRPKLDPYRGVIDRILEDDRSLPKKQRHTAKRIYERLRAEHRFSGKAKTMRERRRRTREMYVPVSPSRSRPVRLRPGQGGWRSGRPSTTSCWIFPTATHAWSKPKRRPRRSATVTSRRSRSWAACPGASCTTTRGWRWPGSWETVEGAYPRLLGAGVALPVRGSVRPARQG